MSDERPSVDQYFMDMTHLVKARGTCPRRQVGAVIVKDKRLLTTGYNGAPRNFPHPIDVGCLRDELQVPKGMLADICPCLHAEQNAILQAATTGVSIEGADLYCTTQPCTQCSRMLANCGIQRVIFAEEYPDPLATGILTTAGVEMYHWDHAANKLHRIKGNTFEQAQDQLRKKWKAGEFHAAPAPGAVIGKRLPVVQGGGAQPSNRLRSVPPSVPAPPPQPEEQSGEEVPDDASGPSARGVRNLRDDPNRAELIRRMAQEKAERRKKQREGL
ncbi:MAG: dCMP deaminase family protein [Candidatus Thermoplasmatota archaeon]